jgi:hypothetical protein
MSTLLDAPQFKPNQRNTLREQLQKALEGISTDGSVDDWSNVYIPQSHLQALDPQRMVIEGMRGSGKSFWTKVLTDSELRQALVKQDIGTDLKESLNKITESHRIALDAGNNGTAFPDSNHLEKLLTSPGVKPEIIWMVAILRLFPIDSELGMPIASDKFDEWTESVVWAGQNPGRISKGLFLLDKQLVQNQKTALVVIDAIDRASHDLSQVSSMGAGLLRILLELRFAKGLRIKAFFREDILSRVSQSVVDGSKLLNNKAILQWSEAELYGLAYYRIAQQSSYFREQFKQITGWAWRKDNAGRQFCEGANDIKVQKLFWCALVGDYMGNGATKGHSYPYIFNHLGDGYSRVAPRIFLVALREALNSTMQQYSDKQNVIHHEAIKDGVRKASGDRVEELKTEYSWIEPALQCIHQKRETIPIDWITLENIWLDNNTDVLNEIESMRDRALIPWRSDASNMIKIGELKKSLMQIGIIKSRMKGNCERIEIPDIYRLAYKIGRKGGISTRKKP